MVTAGAGMRGADSRGVDGDDAAGGCHDGEVREGRGEERGDGRGAKLERYKVAEGVGVICERNYGLFILSDEGLRTCIEAAIAATNPYEGGGREGGREDAGDARDSFLAVVQAGNELHVE